jgi:ZIP family zinc transporter
MTYEIIYQSIIAGLATVLGAGIILVAGRPGEKLLAFLLGFAAGVMTAVIVFDLIPSALVYGNVIAVSLGFLFGLFFMLILDIFISFFSSLKAANKRKSGITTGNMAGSSNKTGDQARFLKMGYLIAIGIALHDLPEGIAIAAGYAAKDSLGLIIALAIGMHNIPEGMATAAPLVMGGISRVWIILTCLLISVFTPVGAVMGIIFVSLSSHFIALLLALAGGAMAFIVKNELIPEAYRRHPNYARLGIAIGICLILALGYFHH